MGKYLVIIRYVVSTICIVLLLWGCDRTTAAPGKSKVVRKKIVVQKVKIANVRTKKTVHSAEMIAAAKPEIKAAPGKSKVVRKKIVVQKVKIAKVHTKKTVHSAEMIAAAKPEIKTVTAKVEKAQVETKKQLVAKTGSDKQPLTAGENAAILTPRTESKLLKLKKPAIKPKSDISEIKQRVRIEKPLVGDNTAASDKLIAAAPQAILTSQITGIPEAYDPAGKIDPFEPLFREKAVLIKKKKRKKRIPRTPLERIDLSQLKLVGIILTSSGNRALVEEASGKGYVIKKGTYIGTNSGKVAKIIKEKVIVEEEFEDVFGKIKIRQREIKIPKPPGEF